MWDQPSAAMMGSVSHLSPHLSGHGGARGQVGEIEHQENREQREKGRAGEE